MYGPGEVEDAAYEGPYGLGGAGGERDGQFVPGGGGGRRSRPRDPAGPAEDAVVAVAGEGFDGELGAFEVLLDEEVGDLGVVPYGGLRPGGAGQEPYALAEETGAGFDHAGEADEARQEGDQRGASAADEGDGPVGV
ncbi:hypothetical protein ADK59_11055 [Streptomyces sp. XY332]|nr:hypothetical protein ADK59_11055 [Streptomyces sp. XY332]